MFDAVSEPNASGKPDRHTSTLSGIAHNRRQTAVGQRMLIFALSATQDFGTKLVEVLGVPLSALEERSFEDGEHKSRPLVDVRGQDTFVVQSLHGGPEQDGPDKLLRLLFFLATLRDHGAARVTAVVPYLAYARKDRRTQPHDPIGSRYVAQLLEAVGTDVLLSLEVHNPAAFDNGFRCRTVHLQSHSLFDRFVASYDDGGPLVLASPDPGGVKRVTLWQQALAPRLGRRLGQVFMDKSRSGGTVGGSTQVVGDVSAATVFVFDDIIATGTTIARAAMALKEAGARRVFAFSAHGLFVGEAAAVLGSAPIERLFVSDSIPPFRLPQSFASSALEVVGSAPLFAAAIRELSEERL
ncbi:MAG TPA: ribose-phosphate diphosphokinase [Burkholderiaceae bacterium]|nr:ribose-phosphate diphosphokinase [Burkholderiaceae bacterium]